MAPKRLWFARRVAALSTALLSLPASAIAQNLAVLQGHVYDAGGALLRGAIITVTDPATGFAVAVHSDDEGRYVVAAIPPATYRVTVQAVGFRGEVIEQLRVDVGRTVVRDFRLAVGDREEFVVVRAEAPLLDRATGTVGHVVTEATIQKIPLNGRHFVDLSLLVPGSVAPSQTGFSARPVRGLGSLAFNTAGGREEAVGFVVNGVSTNNLTFGSLIFEPPIASIQEFKIDNSAFGAEHGHVSGAVVNLVTRSGANEVRGNLFEFVRNDAFDARNFFEFTTNEPRRFQRNQFGGSVGGPIKRGRTFFFASYDGFRQRQDVDLNSLVLSDAQRAATTDPVIQRLIPMIPRANFYDADGTPRFVGPAAAHADVDRWTVDVQQRIGKANQLKIFFGSQQARNREPGASGNSIPGFGLTSRPFGSVLTVSATHLLRSSLLHDVRFGRSRLRGGTYPASELNPAEFGIANGVTRPIGLPQMVVAGDLNFGGPANQPQGRYDTSYVFVDTITRTTGRHTLKLGGEYRHFINDNFAEGTGLFNFPSVDAFLAGIANAFSITLGRRRSVIDQRALGLFFSDSISIHRRATIELGVRYDWHVTPTEREDRFVVFDAASGSFGRVGADLDRIHQQNHRNIEPRVGVAWDLSTDGRTVIRAAYARAVDQPGTTAVRDTAGNPPFAAPLAAAGSIPLSTAIESTRPAGLAPATVDPAFRNAAQQSWNVNVQRQVTGDLAATVGYMGARGSNLRISRNINQPVNGVRPFAMVSAASPILPGAPLGNITQVESSGFSSYNAGWISITKRLSRGLQFDTSYTWSKSLDTNSLNSSGFAVQNAYDIPNQYGLSDFDARHRFVLVANYALPFTKYFLSRGWQVAIVVQSQSGNPVNIVTSNSILTGVANSVRPDVTGPIRIVGSVDQWFDQSVFVAVNRFGNLSRNVVIGPAFHNIDLSLVKTIKPGGRFALQLRADVFDLLNHPNFGAPGNIVGTPTFGKITRTRLPTGEAGSSRQIQFAVELSF